MLQSRVDGNAVAGSHCRPTHWHPEKGADCIGGLRTVGDIVARKLSDDEVVHRHRRVLFFDMLILFEVSVQLAAHRLQQCHRVGLRARRTNPARTRSDPASELANIRPFKTILFANDRAIDCAFANISERPVSLLIAHCPKSFLPFCQFASLLSEASGYPLLPVREPSIFRRLVDFNFHEREPDFVGPEVGNWNRAETGPAMTVPTSGGIRRDRDCVVSGRNGEAHASGNCGADLIQRGSQRLSNCQVVVINSNPGKVLVFGAANTEVEHNLSWRSRSTEDGRHASDATREFAEEFFHDYNLAFSHNTLIPTINSLRLRRTSSFSTTNDKDCSSIAGQKGDVQFKTGGSREEEPGAPLFGL